MKGRFLAILMLVPAMAFSQTYFGDTLWHKDYSSSGAFSCAFSPDGTKLAVSYECMGPMLRVLDVSTGLILWESETPDLCLYNAQFSSTGQYIAIAEELGHLTVFDVNLLDTVYNIDTQTGGLFTVDFSPSGDKIYASGADGTIRIYEAGTGALIHSIPAHSLSVFGLDVSPSGRYVASGGMDNLVKVFDLQDNYQEVYSFSNHTDDVLAVKFSADGKKLFSGGEDFTLSVHDMQTGNLDTTLNHHFGDINVIDVSADGSFAITGSNDQSVAMINLFNYEIVASFTNQQQTRVYGAGISPDMTKMASTNHIGGVILYNISSLIGIEEETYFTTTIYPNPTADWIYFDAQGDNLNYTVYNLNGQKVQSGYSTGSINISSLSSGVYILEIENHFSRIVKQ